MNANTELWIRALRSGAYAQTRGRLREKSRWPWRRTAFCALGVLYDLYLKAHTGRWPDRSPGGRVPEAVLDWAAVPKAIESEVIASNDGGRNFREIASIIEAHFHRADRARRWQEAGRIADQSIERARRAYEVA